MVAAISAVDIFQRERLKTIKKKKTTRGKKKKKVVNQKSRGNEKMLSAEEGDLKIARTLSNQNLLIRGRHLFVMK